MTVDVKHPEAPEGMPEPPMARLGCIGSGHAVTEQYGLREMFAADQSLLAYDAEFDQVLESLHGNRIDSFLVVRGMADYAEGRQATEPSATAANWQPYSALAAAAFTRALVLKLQSL